jgi:cell division transport system permease protein
VIGRRPRLGALARTPGGGGLAGIAGAAIFVVCVTLAAALAAGDATARWRDALARALTVEIAPGPDADAQAERAATLLRTMPGVAAVERLTAARVDALLAPWLGSGARLDDLPLPVLLDLRVAGGRSFDAEAARDLLAAVAPDARLDDHGAWRDAIGRLAWIAIGVAGAVALAAIAAACLAVALATHARLAAHRARVELLHLMGAEDGAIAREFAYAAMAATAAGGALGLGAALALLLAVRRAAAAGMIELGAVPQPVFVAFHWTMLILPLPACTLLAGVAAALTARAALRSLP